MKESIKVIIVDDEPLLIETLQAILNEFCKEVEVIGIATDAFDAKSKIERLKPDAVFLDINMPNVNGFDLLKSIENRWFEVVFITAYDQYAIDALREGAVDYILKPVLSQKVIDSVNRIKNSIAFKHSGITKEDPIINSLNQSHKIVVQYNNTHLFLENKDILWMKADHNYTNIYLASGRIVCSAKSIKHYEGVLSKKTFFRIHKSYIINTEFIKEYIRDSKGPMVVLTENTKLRIAQPKQSEFRKFMIMNSQNM